MGFELETVESRLAALEKWSHEPYDFSDMLKRLDRLEVARAIDPTVLAERMFSFWREQENGLAKPLRKIRSWDQLSPKIQTTWIRLAEKVIANDFLG